MAGSTRDSLSSSDEGCSARQPIRKVHVASRSESADSNGPKEGWQEAPLAKGTAKKPSGACAHCKSLKVRCEPVEGDNRCRRCIAGNHACVSRGRKKRIPAPTHEDLQERSRHQDLQIQRLLQQMDDMRVNDKMARWARQLKGNNIDDPGTSAAGPSTAFLGRKDRILSPSVMSWDQEPHETAKLFSIYFEKINPFFSLLNPELHTPQKLMLHSPFLFSVICANAARWHTSKPHLYDVAIDMAKDAAYEALKKGPFTIETCQAFLIMGVYPVHKKNESNEMSWVYMGAAIRIAQELRLDQPWSADAGPLDDMEAQNRIRTWLTCYCVDASHATQFGKLPMIKLDDYIARHCRNWYFSSPYNLPYDIHLCGYTESLLLVAKFRQATGPKDELDQRFYEGLDVVSVALDYDGKLNTLLSFWADRYAQDPNKSAMPIITYRMNTAIMIGTYLRLVILSTGFQYAVKQGISRDSLILRQAMRAAQRVISMMVDLLYPTGTLRFAMAANFLYVAFAAAFLLNLLRPKFRPLLDPSQCQSIVSSVAKLVRILGSKEVALDGRHTPALYSKFLSSLLSKHAAGLTPVDEDRDSPPTTIVPQYTEQQQQPPPHAYTWPDTSELMSMGPPSSGAFLPFDGSYVPDLIFQRIGEANMDFSLGHFLHAMSAEEPQIPPQTQADLRHHPDMRDAFAASGHFDGQPLSPVSLHDYFQSVWSARTFT